MSLWLRPDLSICGDRPGGEAGHVCAVTWDHATVNMPDGFVAGEEFKKVLAPLSTRLLRYAELIATQPDKSGFLPAADSPALAERAAEGKWAHPDWEQPLFNAQNFGSLLVTFLCEHLAGLALVTGAPEVGPSYVNYSLLRPILDTAPVAYWLLEPGIAYEVRAKRGLTYRLESAVNLARHGAIPSAKTDSERTIASIRLVAKHHGWQCSKTKESVGGETRPHPKRSFSSVALGNAAPKLDDAMWNLVSATFHGTSYALLQALRQDHAIIGPDGDSMTAPIVVSSDHVSFLCLLGWRGVQAAANARAALMGWVPSDELGSVTAELNELTARLTRGR